MPSVLVWGGGCVSAPVDNDSVSGGNVKLSKGIFETSGDDVESSGGNLSLRRSRCVIVRLLSKNAPRSHAYSTPWHMSIFFFQTNTCLVYAIHPTIKITKKLNHDKTLSLGPLLREKMIESGDSRFPMIDFVVKDEAGVLGIAIP